MTDIFTPINILFIIILLGLLIGKIKIFNISLGLSGILFMAIICGILIKENVICIDDAYIYDLQNKMKIFSLLGSSLFVSVIGINTGRALKSNAKGNLMAMIIGVCMTLTGVLVAMIIANYSSALSKSTLLGILCGALTSTPALAAVCDSKDVVTSDAAMGYSCAYLMGVVLVVMMVGLISSKSFDKIHIEKNDKANNQDFFISFMLICCTVIVGNIVGYIQMFNGYLSLGVTGGILCVGTVFGAITSKSKSDYNLNIFRSIGLSLFFAGTGICAGLELANFNLKIILFGMIITISSLLCGIFITCVVGQKLGLNTTSILAGGMTSSPALGILYEKKREFSISQFSFAYFGALISLVIFIGILLKISIS